MVAPVSTTGIIYARGLLRLLLGGGAGASPLKTPRREGARRLQKPSLVLRWRPEACNVFEVIVGHLTPEGLSSPIPNPLAFSIKSPTALGSRSPRTQADPAGPSILPPHLRVRRGSKGSSSPLSAELHSFSSNAASGGGRRPRRAAGVAPRAALGGPPLRRGPRLDGRRRLPGAARGARRAPVLRRRLLNLRPRGLADLGDGALRFGARRRAATPCARLAARSRRLLFWRTPRPSRGGLLARRRAGGRRRTGGGGGAWAFWASSRRVGFGRPRDHPL